MGTTTERREPLNAALATSIDVGIAYQHALGIDVARAYYVRQSIAPAIVARVLAAAGRRRRAPADGLVTDRHGDAGGAAGAGLGGGGKAR